MEGIVTYTLRSFSYPRQLKAGSYREIFYSFFILNKKEKSYTKSPRV